MTGDKEEIRESALRRIVALALDEDLDSAGDITSRAIFEPDAAGAAHLVSSRALHDLRHRRRRRSACRSIRTWSGCRWSKTVRRFPPEPRSGGSKGG